jgi:hypothetical protein
MHGVSREIASANAYPECAQLAAKSIEQDWDRLGPRSLAKQPFLEMAPEIGSLLRDWSAPVAESCPTILALGDQSATGECGEIAQAASLVIKATLGTTEDSRT